MGVTINQESSGFQVLPEVALLKHVACGLMPVEQGDFVTIPVPPEIGAGRVTLGVVAKGIFVAATDLTPRESMVLSMPGRHLIRFRAWLSHRHVTASPGALSSQALGPHSSIAFVPEHSEQQLHLEKGKRLRFMGVLCEPSALIELVDSESWRGAAAHIRLDSNEVQACFMPVDPKVDAAATDLIDPPYTGRAGALLCRSRALELVTRLLQTPHDLVRHLPSRTPLTAAEIDRLNHARAILVRSVNAPITIDKLAKMTALGRSKLSQGFKALFGETTFDFSERLRMELARDLLRSRAMTIAQVAEHVGYQHQSTFSTAFRKYFGTSPKSVRI